MRILLSLPGGIAQVDRGVQIPVFIQLLNSLSRRVELTVLVPDTHLQETSVALDQAIDIIPIPMAEAAVPTGREIHLIRSIVRTIRARRPALVHAFWALPMGFAAVVAGRVTRVPSVVSFFGAETASIPEIRYGNVIRPSTRWATAFVVRFADHLHLLTKFQERQLRFFFPSKDAVSVIPLGIDRIWARFEPKRRRHSPFRVLHVASNVPVKDQETLLRAFAFVHKSIDALLNVVGPRLSSDPLLTLAGELGIASFVRFTGFVPHTAIWDLYDWADVFVLSSLYESQGIVVSEAALRGVQVVGTRTGIIADWEGTRALAVSPGQPEALAQAILRCHAGWSALEGLRRTAHQWVLQHDVEWTADQMLHMYENTLATRRHPRKRP